MTRVNLLRSHEKNRATIARLRRKLAAEQALSRALQELAFAPKQDPEKMRFVKRALTIKQKIS